MRTRFKTLVLAFMLAGLSISQTGTQLVTPDIRRIGDKLACKCGSCNNTVANCPMVQCHYASPAREKIMKMVAAGMSDQAIIDSFVKEVGLAALAVPPAEGFNLLGWVMPFVGILLGLGAIGLYMKRFRRPEPAPAVAGTQPINDEYRKRIDKELADLE